MKAIWNDQVIAESDQTVIVENNHYFPPESIKKEYFKPSSTKTICPWKGQASYYTVEVEGRANENAAWYYPEPSDLASHIKGHVAFWKGVEITE